MLYAQYCVNIIPNGSDNMQYIPELGVIGGGVKKYQRRR